MSFTTITGLINTVIDNISKNLQNYYKEKRINWEKHRESPHRTLKIKKYILSLNFNPF
jgi:hypothetical protein